MTLLTSPATIEIPRSNEKVQPSTKLVFSLSHGQAPFLTIPMTFLTMQGCHRAATTVNYLWQLNVRPETSLTSCFSFATMVLSPIVALGQRQKHSIPPPSTTIAGLDQRPCHHCHLLVTFASRKRTKNNSSNLISKVLLGKVKNFFGRHYLHYP